MRLFFVLKFTHTCFSTLPSHLGHWRPCWCSVSGVCGPLSERPPASLPTLAGHGEALQRSVGPLCMGYTVHHSHSVHLHRRTSFHMGAGMLLSSFTEENVLGQQYLSATHLLCAVFLLQVAFFLFLSLSVYTVLPLSMAWALIVGIWTSLTHIVIISVYVPVTSPDTPDLAVQVTMKHQYFVQWSTEESWSQLKISELIIAGRVQTHGITVNCHKYVHMQS